MDVTEDGREPVYRYDADTGAFISVFIQPGDAGNIRGLVYLPGTTASPQTQVSPSHGDNAGSVTVQITGVGFRPGATVKLTGVGPDIIASKATVVTGSTISATFDLNEAAPGIRNMVITNSDKTGNTMAAAFTVEQRGSQNLTFDLVGRDKIRFGSTQQYYAIIQNHGTVDASNVAVFLNESGLLPSSSQLAAKSVQLTSAVSPVSAFFGPVHALSSVVIPFTAIVT